MAWIRRSAGRTAVAMALVVCAGMAALAQQDPIKARQAAMKLNGQALRSIDRIIQAGGNPADVIAPANKIADIAGEIPTLFPTGSGPARNAGKTEADAAIWQQFDDFSAKAANLQSQARMLAAAAQTGDLAIVRAQFDKMVQGCGDCHKSYRHRS
jgi:cytochrome c556